MFIFNIFDYIISINKHKFCNMIQEIISVLSFPGVVFHELGHELFCRWSKVKVIKVCYFQFKNPAGYVIHSEPQKYYQAFLISVGPLIFGTLFSIIFFLMSKYFSNNNQLLEILFIWLGGSLAMNCFPSTQDAKVLFQETNKHILRNLFVIIGYPFVLIIFLFGLLKTLWIDLLYGFVLYFIASFINLSF